MLTEKISEKSGIFSVLDVKIYRFATCIHRFMVFKLRIIASIRYLAVTVLLFITQASVAQKYKALGQYKDISKIPAESAIFYGSFIQRLGWGSGGFPQDIRLINNKTGEIFTFNVKSAGRTAKESKFMYVIPPGRYSILHYWWIHSKWYGAKVFTEPIFKNVDSNDIADKLNSGQIKESDLERFSFNLEPNSLNYVGTWHFDSGIVSFTDDKVSFDNTIRNEYRSLNFTNAITNLPN